MNLAARITAFTNLGQRIEALTAIEREAITERARNENAWFTPESVMLAFNGIRHFLHRSTLEQWTSRYPLDVNSAKLVGVAMAGNIPLVGFHDFLCVLMAGHRLIAKKSSQDAYLINLLSDWLIEIEPRFKDRIQFEDRLNAAQAMIATGSDNTARYFEYYFRHLPYIIRKNRSSCAVLMGEEDPALLMELGKDVFTYFGLGCRNVSKVYVPEEYDFSILLKTWEGYASILHHHKYNNNYEYQKSILLINGTPFLDTGFVLVTASDRLVSPISVLYYETYASQADLHSKLQQHTDKIQCIVSANGWYAGSLPFGTAQMPDVGDYADRIDTMKFLTELV